MIIKKIALLIISLFDYFHQKKIISFLKNKNFREFNLVLDVGAHKGETINLFLKNFKIKQIISFEASPKNFKSLIARRFKIKNRNQIKKTLTKLILRDKDKIKKLEKIIHPLVRKKMRSFTSQNRDKRFLFYEIPLLIESKLMKYFNVIIFIKAKKQLRLRRFKAKCGDKKLFNLLDEKQLKDNKKTKFCDYVIVNEKNLNILKKKLYNIIKKYE